MIPKILQTDKIPSNITEYLDKFNVNIDWRNPDLIRLFWEIRVKLILILIFLLERLKELLFALT
jgi:hypothetical protein